MNTNLASFHESALIAAQTAYCAHDVAGSDKRLCYQGRITRAVRLQAEAHAAGDAERVKRIQKAIDQVAAEWTAKEKAANVAVARYHGAGGTAQVSVTCQCEECVALVEPTIRYIKLTEEDAVVRRPPTWEEKKREKAMEKQLIRKTGKTLIEYGRAQRDR